MKEIIIEVSNEGEVRLKTKGFKGKACLKESQFIKDVLGKEVSQALTPAYFQENKEEVKKYLCLCG